MLIDAPPTSSCTPADIGLEIRIRREFAEMPGLKITLRQACRLFGAESGLCEGVLTALTSEGALLNIAGVFVRPGCCYKPPSRDNSGRYPALCGCSRPGF
jgi:hypothetical protein